MASNEPANYLATVPEARTGLLIRRPVDEVFEALVDPAKTSKFWFSRGSGRLDSGVPVTWHWDMYGVAVTAEVREYEQHRRILFDWGGPDEASTSVEWTFAGRPDGSTFVTVRNFGFTGGGDELCAAACDATQGFTFMLAGLKAYLEHGIELNLVPDVYPDAHVEGWVSRQG